MEWREGDLKEGQRKRNEKKKGKNNLRRKKTGDKLLNVFGGREGTRPSWQGRARSAAGQ
jgi:hypothetical protein